MSDTCKYRIAKALSEKNHRVIRLRCQRFGPQTVPSLARALGLDISRRGKRGRTTPNQELLDLFEAALDELVTQIGLEKESSLNDPAQPAYKAVARREAG